MFFPKPHIWELAVINKFLVNNNYTRVCLEKSMAGEPQSRVISCSFLLPE